MKDSWALAEHLVNEQTDYELCNGLTKRIYGEINNANIDLFISLFAENFVLFN